VGANDPELVEALPGLEIIDRSSVNAYDDARVARAIEATGRKKLIFAGLSLEVCAAFPAMTAVSRGLDAYVAVGCLWNLQRDQASGRDLRMAQAGVVVSDYTTLMVEILKDNARRRPVPSTEPWIWIGQARRPNISGQREEMRHPAAA